MLEIIFPGQRTLKTTILVCDINGTLTLDGQLIAGVQTALDELKPALEVHLLSADTLGKADEIASTLRVELHKIRPGNEAKQKGDLINQLGPTQVVAIGQGANDALMLKQSALGICVISPEGTASAALQAADLVAPDILTALALLKNPKRIVATLRE